MKILILSFLLTFAVLLGSIQPSSGSSRPSGAPQRVREMRFGMTRGGKFYLPNDSEYVSIANSEVTVRYNYDTKIASISQPGPRGIYRVDIGPPARPQPSPGPSAPRPSGS